MREYDVHGQLTKVQCNRCKKELHLELDIIKEGYFSVDYSWGYFSSRDGVRHQFDLCEKCYEQFVDGFAIPVTEFLNTELI